jgi:phosphoglycerol transferase MdoB-like AlkP superfamily enzyme
MKGVNAMLVKRILVLMVFYQICRLLFLAFNHIYFGTTGLGDLWPIFVGSLRFDASALMYLNVVYIFLFVLPFGFRYNKTYQKVAKWIFIITNSVGILANLADIGYYPFLLHRTNASFFLEFKHDTNLLFEAGEFLLSYWPLSLIGAFMVYVLHKSYEWIKMPHRQPVKWWNWGTVPIMVILWLGLARGSFRPENRPLNISYAGDYANNPSEVNLVLNTPFSIMSTWGNIKLKDVNYFASQEDAAQYYSPVQSFSDTVGTKRKNIVIIIVESLSKEFIGGLNKDKANYKSYTPFLDRLLEQSLTFNHSFANGKRSIEALPSITASIPSLQEAYVLTPYCGNQINSLGNIFQTKGYHTSFFHGASEGSMGFSAFMKTAGFTHTFSRKEFNNDSEFDGMWGIWDEPFLQFWAKQMNTFQEPFCSVLFTVSSHHPFKLPEQYKGKFPTGPLDIHPSIGYTDMALEKFFDSTSKMPWYQNTVFVLTADHAATYAHEETYQSSVGAYSVPIIFFTPDGSLRGRLDGPAQHTDVFPTLIHHLGLDEKIIVFGNNALDTTQNPIKVNCYGGIFQAFDKEFMLQFDGEKPIGLYRYKIDPRLTTNRLGDPTIHVNHLVLALKAYIQQYTYRVKNNKLTP